VATAAVEATRDTDARANALARAALNPFSPEFRAAAMLQRRFHTFRSVRAARETAAVRATNSNLAAFATPGDARPPRGRPRFALDADTAAATAADARRHALKRRLIDDDTGKPWAPRPRTTLDVVMVTTTPAPALGTLNASGLLAVARLIVTSQRDDRTALLRIALGDTAMSCAQGQELIDRINSSSKPLTSGETVDAVAALAERAVDSEAVPALIDRNLSDDQAQSLRRMLGGAYDIFTGALSGRHLLDVHRRVDRAALYRLVAEESASAAARKERLEASSPDAEESPGPRGFAAVTIDGKPAGASTLDALANNFGGLGEGTAEPVEAPAKAPPKAPKKASKKAPQKAPKAPVAPGKGRHIAFDYLAPPATGTAAPDARVATLLHACGMKLDPDTIAASPRLARLLPGHLFLEATKRSPVVEGPAEALECVGAPGSAPAPAPSYREAKRLSGRYSTEDDLADWLAERDVSLPEDALAALSEDLVRGLAVLRCDIDVGEDETTLRIVRTTCDARVRVCHPHVQAVLAWRRRTEEAIAPVPVTTTKRAAQQPLDGIVWICRLQALVRAAFARAAARAARGERPPTETFVELRIPLDANGKPTTNPARRAVVGVARALVDRLNVDVRPDDVRATLRVRKTEPATAAAPRRLEGIQSEAVVYYYDTYVRGLPPYVRTSRHSPYERATWTPYEDCEAPPPDDLDASAVVAAVRSATTTEQFTCDQIRAIVATFIARAWGLEHARKRRRDAARREQEAEAKDQKRREMERMAALAGGRMTSPSPTPGALPQDRRSSLAHSQAAARGQALTPRTRNREVDDDGKPPPSVERSLGDLVVHLYSRCSGPPEDFYADVLVPSFEDKKRRKAIIARLGWDAPTFRRLEAEAAARLEAEAEACAPAPAPAPA